MSKKVFVYTIPRQTATNVSGFVNDTSGKSLKKTKVGRAKNTIRAMYDPKIGGLANYISYTLWMDENGVPMTDEKGNNLTLQDKLEQKWNLPKGFLTNRPWRKGDSIKEDDLTYYTKKSWVMKDGCTVLDLSNMDDELGYYVLLASYICANSEREYLEHKWPKAQYYIALENESEEIKYSRNEIKSRAFSSLHSPEMTEVYKRKFVSLLGIATTKANLTNQQVHNLLFEYIDKTSFTPGSNVEKFQALFNMLSTPTGREELEARYLLKQALDTKVVYEKQDVYTWVRPTGSITLGDRYQDAIEFLLSPKKAAEVEELTEEIKKRLQ